MTRREMYEDSPTCFACSVADLQLGRAPCASRTAARAALFTGRRPSADRDDHRRRSDFYRRFYANTGTWSTKSDDKDLTYAYKDRAFHLRIGKDNSTVWRTNTKMNELKLTNFYLEADAAQVDGPPDGEFGLVFHEVNSDNFYLFAIRQAGAYSLWKHVDQDCRHWDTGPIRTPCAPPKRRPIN